MPLDGEDSIADHHSKVIVIVWAKSLLIACAEERARLNRSSSEIAENQHAAAG